MKPQRRALHGRKKGPGSQITSKKSMGVSRSTFDLNNEEHVAQYEQALTRFEGLRTYLGPAYLILLEEGFYLGLIESY